jgi:oligopeptidase B
VVRADPYRWMIGKSPKLRAHLEAENAYARQVLEPLRALEDTLEAQLRAQVPDDEESAPWTLRGFRYQLRFGKGQQHPALWRAALAGGEAQQVFDLNAFAAATGYAELSGFAVSDDDSTVALVVDTGGGGDSTLHVRRIEGAVPVGPPIAHVGSAAFTADRDVLAVVELDAALRAARLVKRSLGTAQRLLLWEEKDAAFSVEISRSASGRYLLLESQSTLSSEVRLWPAALLRGTGLTLRKRARDVHYTVEDAGEGLAVLIDDEGKDYRLFYAATPVAVRFGGTALVPNTPGTVLEAMIGFRKGVALLIRVDARAELRWVELSSGESSVLALPGAPRALALGTQNGFEASEVVAWGSSLTQPGITWSIGPGSPAREVHRAPVPPGFEPGRYREEERVVTAADGAKIPVSLVRRADLAGKPGPILLYGYGAYGDCSDPDFDRALLPLLDRGVGYAIASVRGGGERGQAWHDAGRFDQKHRSFDDLAAVAQALVDEGVAAPGAIVLRGASAGGLLMASTLVQHPERFAGAVLESPFVDVLDGMLDPALPLTTGEYDEWGDPRRPADAAWMRAWAPMELLAPHAYPAVLATASWSDTAVRV